MHDMQEMVLYKSWNLISPKLAVIASMSFGFRLRGRPFWRGCCGNPVRPTTAPLLEPAARWEAE